MASETTLALHELIETLSEEEAQDLLDYLRMQRDPDELTDEEQEDFAAGLAEIQRGEFVTGEDLERPADTVH